MQIKTTMSYHFTPVRIAIIKKKQQMLVRMLKKKKKGTLIHYW